MVKIRKQLSDLRFSGKVFVLFTVTFFGLSCGDGKELRDRSATSGNSTVDSLLTAQQGNGAPRPIPKKPVDEMSKAERFEYIAELEKAGYYVCCIEPECTMCLYDEEETCSCRESVKLNDPVCGECYKGWKKGKGAVEGIAVTDVKRK